MKIVKSISMWTPGMDGPIEVPLIIEMTKKDLDDYIKFWSSPNNGKITKKLAKRD